MFDLLQGLFQTHQDIPKLIRFINGHPEVSANVGISVGVAVGGGMWSHRLHESHRGGGGEAAREGSKKEKWGDGNSVRKSGRPTYILCSPSPSNETIGNG